MPNAHDIDGHYETATEPRYESVAKSAQVDGPLSQSIGDLHRTIGELEDEIDALRVQLTAFVAPQPESAVVGERLSDPEPPHSQVTYQVREAQQRVRRLRDILSELRGSIEV